jgi:hypothetical protein
MKFYADLACESHGSRQHLAQVFECILKLLRYRATDDNIKEFERILNECVDTGDSIVRSGRVIYLNGSIDMDALAEHVVWIGTHKTELGS